MSTVVSSSSRAVMPADDILRVAQADARQVYEDLLRFRVTLELADDGWHVDYELADQRVNGGGARYIIDAESGMITTKRYEQ